MQRPTSTSAQAQSRIIGTLSRYALDFERESVPAYLCRPVSKHFAGMSSRISQELAEWENWRDQVLHAFANERALPPQIDSGNVDRVQLLSTFLNLYLPGARDESIDQLTYMRFIPDLSHKSPLLRISCHALALAFIGSVFDDVRLQMVAVKQYVSAIAFLRLCVAPDPTAKCLRKDTILASLILLAHCEVHQCISDSGQEPGAFLTHLNGAQAFFDANRSEILQTNLGRALCMSLRSNAFLIGLATRKSVRHDFGLTAHISTLPEDQPLLSLNDIALRVPNILETHDALRRDHYPYHVAMLLADQVFTLKLRWITCFEEHYPNRRGCRTTEMIKMKTFTKYWPDEVANYKQIFTFDSYQVWAHYAGYWSVLWELNMVQLDLLESADIPASLFLRNESESLATHGILLQETLVFVENLCLAFPASCEPDNIVFSPLRSTSSRRMREFLTKYGHRADLEWLDAVDTMVSMTGTSWDVQCKFGHSGSTKISRIAGSLQAWNNP
jgi:hypothetical protein